MKKNKDWKKAFEECERERIMIAQEAELSLICLEFAWKKYQYECEKNKKLEELTQIINKQ